MKSLYNTTQQTYIEHEWYEHCFSIRDILQCDQDEVLITWDHDNIEGKIHDIIVNDKAAIEAHREGKDLHTITCCNIFNYTLPPNLFNPHTTCTCNTTQKGKSNNVVETTAPCVHCQWRNSHNWQGKDTKQRVLAKNFNHGSKYSKTWRFVYNISGIENYGVSYESLGNLAKAYIKSKQEPWDRKLSIISKIQKAKVARTLYGFRRTFYDSSEDTGKEGFSHMISGTVTDYNNMTLQILNNQLGNAFRFIHNAHDGDKIAVKKDFVPSMDELKSIIERGIEYQNRSLTMTAGVKIYDIDST